MVIKINTTITLSTGESVSGAVVSLFNENFILSQTKFRFDMLVWRSETDMNTGKDYCYLFNGNRITTGSYTIPTLDMNQASIDGHFGVIGTNHPIRIKDEFASMLSINSADVEILSLV